jgi:hypothetical protein
VNGPRGPVCAKTYSSGDPLPLAPALPGFAAWCADPRRCRDGRPSKRRFTEDHPYPALTVRSVTVIQDDEETTSEFLAVATAPADEWMKVVETTAIKAGTATIIGHASRDTAPTMQGGLHPPASPLGDPPGLRGPQRSVGRHRLVGRWARCRRRIAWCGCEAAAARRR